jgi:hypothetical protein
MRSVLVEDLFRKQTVPCLYRINIYVAASFQDVGKQQCLRRFHCPLFAVFATNQQVTGHSSTQTNVTGIPRTELTYGKSGVRAGNAVHYIADTDSIRKVVRVL